MSVVFSWRGFYFYAYYAYFAVGASHHARSSVIA
jgi:hypothetical protein